MKAFALVLALAVLAGCKTHESGIVHRKTLLERWQEFVKSEDERAATFVANH